MKYLTPIILAISVLNPLHAEEAKVYPKKEAKPEAIHQVGSSTHNVIASAIKKEKAKTDIVKEELIGKEVDKHKKRHSKKDRPKF